jgi:hypothetical protein
LVVAGILGYAATKPDTFRTERSININASAEAIYPMLEDLHAWDKWSPFPDGEKVTYSGAEKGKGSITAWSGKTTGDGSREITEVTPNEMVRMKIEFPAMKAHFMADITLKREGEGTKVTWANYGNNMFMAKVFGIFMSMDKMMGDDMQSRLVSLKKTVEAMPAPVKAAAKAAKKK